MGGNLCSHRWTVALVLVASLVVAVCGPSKVPAAGPIVLIAGVSNPKGDIFSNAMDKFAELVAAKANGEVTVSVAYSGAVGGNQQLIQNTKTGSVDFGWASNGNAARFSNAYFVLDLPFLFKSNQALVDTMNSSIGQEMNAAFEKDVGVKILSIWCYGVGRDIQTRNKQVKVPADIKGMKIRTVSTPVEISTFRAWGANPSPVDWSQTYAAVQQGVVDGAEIMLPQLIANKYFEIMKYNLSVSYSQAAALFYMNVKKFNSLSPRHQEAILAAAEEAKQFNYKEAAELAKTAEQELTKNGMIFYHPTPDEYVQWTSVREQVWEDVAKQEKGKINMDLAKRIYNSQK